MKIKVQEIKAEIHIVWEGVGFGLVVVVVVVPIVVVAVVVDTG